MATKLILIRHGATDWNLERRYSSFTDIDINDKGKKQARKLYKRLKREGIHKVYSSDRKRAFNFARIVLKGKKIQKLVGLGELNFGIFEGLTYEEIMKRYPKIYKRWLKDPFSIVIPNGEDLSNFKKRIVKTLKKIISLNKDKTIAVVCHGGAISIFINHILKSRNLWSQIPNIGGLSIIEYKNGRPKIQLLNDTTYYG